MNKRKFILLLGGSIGAIALFLLIWSSLSPQIQIPLKYERSVVRNNSNQEEKTALAVAESINYSSIVARERFDGSSDPQVYLHPGLYLEYTYANFVDSEVINYYETRYENLQGRGAPKQIQLTYEAKATKRSEFRIFNSPAPESVNWHNTTIVISAPDGSLESMHSSNLQLFFRNQSAYQTLQWGYDLNFSDCYVVEMKLVYSEVYAPLAAFWSDVYQIVVLDRNFSPVLVALESQKVIS